MSIEVLQVHKKLLVNDIILEPKRVKATYSIIKNDGSVESNELIYSYSEKYFDPKSAASINLASMMAVQVGMNYGLFFKEIEFDGLFDKADKRFVLDMMENTSREIFVNKFLFENEFLKDEVKNLKAEKRERYLLADVHFTNTKFLQVALTNEPINTIENRYTILSSGGKDSLLTYGLIKEIGVPYPVFINESGRHWFTAINSYKYYQEQEPNTVKPWCNSDRIFNWFVKHMPFIKPNYQNIRADIYPIRLWTVSVFLFGVLPVALHNRTRNILIGNEYDSTIKSTEQGITHYSATYDQSKFFDNSLSRYYKQKGWQINQFSVLRPLSEMLILKILVKRYPHLQEQQISCHAAHEKDGRIYPCGKCEKCRRIVGLLKSMDEDPKRCGYTEEQIQLALKSLEKKSVKQLGSDASHLYHILLEKGLLEKNDFTLKNGKPFPNILKLRIDKSRSSISDLPKYIRQAIFDIYQQYSNGTVEMIDHKWQTVQNLNEQLASIPYSIEKQ